MGPLLCGSPLPKALGDRQCVQGGTQGHACSAAAPRTALVWVLAPGSMLSPQTVPAEPWCSWWLPPCQPCSEGEAGKEQPWF